MPTPPRTIARPMPNADGMLATAAARADELAAPGLSPHPRRKVAVLACMDTRIDLYAILGLERGDAHIIRNAGGLVTDDAIRSLGASQRLLGTEEIVVVMHEDCGLHGASEDDFARAARPPTARCRPGAWAPSTTSRRRCATASTACARAPSSPPATTSAASSSTRRPERCAKAPEPLPGRAAGRGDPTREGAAVAAPLHFQFIPDSRPS